MRIDAYYPHGHLVSNSGVNFFNSVQRRDLVRATINFFLLLSLYVCSFTCWSVMTWINFALFKFTNYFIIELIYEIDKMWRHSDMGNNNPHSQPCSHSPLPNSGFPNYQRGFSEVPK